MSLVICCPTCKRYIDRAWCPNCGEITAAGMEVATLRAKLTAAEAESARLAALLTEAERERDTWKATCEIERECRLAGERDQADSNSAISRLRALLTEAREALEPFAAETCLDCFGRKCAWCGYEGQREPNRRARSLLARLTPKEALPCICSWCQESIPSGVVCESCKDGLNGPKESES